MHFHQSHLLYYLYIGETCRRLGDRFREHLRDVEINDKDASKPVARHFNLPNFSQKHMAVCGLSLHLGNTESRKNVEQKFIFQIGTLSPCGINERYLKTTLKDGSLLILIFLILIFGYIDQDHSLREEIFRAMPCMALVKKPIPSSPARSK